MVKNCIPSRLRKRNLAQLGSIKYAVVFNYLAIVSVSHYVVYTHGNIRVKPVHLLPSYLGWKYPRLRLRAHANPRQLPHLSLPRPVSSSAES